MLPEKSDEIKEPFLPENIINKDLQEKVRNSILEKGGPAQP
jgi:hypothetical protein